MWPTIHPKRMRPVTAMMAFWAIEDIYLYSLLAFQLIAQSQVAD